MKSTKVFISYSHDSRDHADRVLAFANQLRGDGIEAILDQFEPFGPPEGWQRWMTRNLREADFVVMICTERYYARFMEMETPGEGQGVRWEGNLIFTHLSEADVMTRRFLPVLLADGKKEHIPDPLRPFNRYSIADEQSYLQLYRCLTNQPAVMPVELGAVKALPKMDRRQDFFSESPKSTAITKDLGIPAPRLVRVHAGEFVAGGSWFTRRRLTLPEFEIGKFPVTNAEYHKFVYETQRDAPRHWNGVAPVSMLDYPVVYVSFRDAMEYCEWLGWKLRRSNLLASSQFIRLPTEDEWEKAARGTDGREYPWGPKPGAANIGNPLSDTTPIGKFSPSGDSPYGATDMVGNVWEWCGGKRSFSSHPVRGGSFKSWIHETNCYYSRSLHASSREEDLGFRVVLSPYA